MKTTLPKTAMCPSRGRLLTVVLTLLVGAGAGPARADLTLRYGVSEAELVLFKQPQPAPFDQLAMRIFVQGARVRTELVDHFGREHWFITDRSTGRTLALDPVAKIYWQEAGQWTCAGLPDHLAASLARMLAQVGGDSLYVAKAQAEMRNGKNTKRLRVEFSGRVLGAPRPVDAVMEAWFPADEESVLGDAGTRDLYCGSRPDAGVWRAAFERYLPMGAAQAGYLADVAAVPLELSIVTDLGIGSARVSVRLNEITHSELEGALFAPPSDFAPRDR